MELKELIGKKIKCLGMVDDPNPIEYGMTGTVVYVGGDVINVKWDNGRNLGLIVGVDKYEILPN